MNSQGHSLQTLVSCSQSLACTALPPCLQPSQPVRCEIITREMNEQTVYVVVIEPSTFEVSRVPAHAAWPSLNAPASTLVSSAC